MLDIARVVRVHVGTLMAAQNDMGVCDAIERNAPPGGSAAMSAPHMPKVAGINSVVPAPAHAAPPLDDLQAPPVVLIQDRLAGWVSDLTTLHELTERLARTDHLDAALPELLRAGAALVGARRGLVVLEPADGLGPRTTVGLGLSRSDLGHLETVPRSATGYGALLDDAERAAPGARPEAIACPDLFAGPAADRTSGAAAGSRLRDVATRLGFAATYAVPLVADRETNAAGEPAGERPPRLGAVMWLYDEPAEPDERARHLAGLYSRYAGEHLARLVELERARARLAAVADELLPSRLPSVPGVRMAVCHRTGPLGGGDFYDALPLPEGALGLAVGSVSGSGPAAVAAMGRLRASLRAYAVMEGEDPVAVLSDLEMLLTLTEPARTATALFAFAEPATRRVVLAGAGHAPPLLVGDRRCEYIETTLSAPLGMLSCWEAPSVELAPAPGETVLLYTDGLLRRTGDPMDRAYARLHAAAASVPAAVRDDPAAVAEHVVRTVLADAGVAHEPAGAGGGTEDIVLLAVRFD
ncbi:PP2C family protein-serine/threonine phosphatase [Streptomyces montanisoli]|uniref:Serine/threonine-protein phosphatase n=1 Tax=Streptomyces montanisoli TaxID=2798581 RepID=A0A940RUQ9_9ACTN|nr:PP2C family protein-serine/threonine phosphatase [Streptomyces montanisoli]MBP0457480.1 serine/threonine-protein phosphatase [Streptomyces montanisoli]